MIERIDLLDQENQDLKGQVSDLEEEREALEMCLEKVNEEKEKAEEKWKKQQVRFHYFYVYFFQGVQYFSKILFQGALNLEHIIREQCKFFESGNIIITHINTN